MRKPFHQNWTLTQGFGQNPSSYARFNLKGHNGLDYALPSGTDVLAPHSGKVVEVAFDAPGYGLYIKIENSKEGSVLAHLKDNLVSIGAIVTEGQLIAHSGNTGNSTGPHLHWGYYLIPRNRQNGYGGFIDQFPILKDDSGSDYYKGYDLTNKDSMRVSVDVLVKLQAGELVDKSKFDTLEREAMELRKRPASCPPAISRKAELELIRDTAIKALS